MSLRNKHITNSTLLNCLGGEDRKIYYQKVNEYDALGDDLKALENAIQKIRLDIDTAKNTKYWDGSYIVRRRLEMRYLIKLENNLSVGKVNQDLLNEYGIN